MKLKKWPLWNTIRKKSKADKTGDLKAMRRDCSIDPLPNRLFLLIAPARCFALKV